MKRYIVEFDKNINETEKLMVIQSVNAIHVSNIFQNFELIECDTDAFELLKQHDAVITIELDGLCEAQDVESPTFFPNELINVLGNAHEHGFKGDNVAVAIIDSGINYEHEDLQFDIYKCARILNGSVVSTDVLTDVKDLSGHGTHVASVIAMQENGIGYVGVAPNVKLIVIKATGGNTSMSHADMAKSITWAVDNGASVINVSYSQTTVNSIVRTACQYAYDNGSIVVASAGNNGFDLAVTGSLTSTERVNFWKDYLGAIVVGGVKERENYNGKMLLELPIQFYRYDYRAIYYNSSNQRYRILLSDKPILLKESTSPEAFFTLVLEGYNQVFDYFPINENGWIISRERNNSPYVISFLSGDISPTNPHFTYANHDIINQRDENIVQFSANELENHKKFVVENHGEYLSDYVVSHQNIIKAPFSSFGRGIHFVAPAYFNLARINMNNEYGVRSGTSYSSPFVAGVITILKQKFPHFTFDEIYKLLKDYAVTVGDGNVNYYGNGLVTMPDMSKLSLIEKVYYKGFESKLEKFIYLSK